MVSSSSTPTFFSLLGFLIDLVFLVLHGIFLFRSTMPEQWRNLSPRSLLMTALFSQMLGFAATITHGLSRQLLPLLVSTTFHAAGTAIQLIAIGFIFIKLQYVLESRTQHYLGRARTRSMIFIVVTSALACLITVFGSIVYTVVVSDHYLHRVKPGKKKNRQNAGVYLLVARIFDLIGGTAFAMIATVLLLVASMSWWRIRDTRQRREMTAMAPWLARKHHSVTGLVAVLTLETLSLWIGVAAVAWPYSARHLLLRQCFQCFTDLFASGLLLAQPRLVDISSNPWNGSVNDNDDEQDILVMNQISLSN